MVISIAGLKDVDKFPWNEFVTWGSHPNSQFKPTRPEMNAKMQ
jgi:hypothetical protein